MSDLAHRPIPSLPLQLHNRRLLMRKRKLLLLIKPRLHQIVNKPVPLLASIPITIFTREYPLLIIHPRLKHNRHRPRIAQKHIYPSLVPPIIIIISVEHLQCTKLLNQTPTLPAPLNLSSPTKQCTPLSHSPVSVYPPNLSSLTQ